MNLNGKHDHSLCGVSNKPYIGRWSYNTAEVNTVSNVHSILFKELNEKDDVYMETLYQVTVVTKKKEIILDKKLVSVDQENAKFEAGLYDVLSTKGLTPSDVTVIVATLGKVAVDKEPKEK